MKKILYVLILVVSTITIVIRRDFLGGFPTKYDGGVWWRATSPS